MSATDVPAEVVVPRRRRVADAAAFLAMLSVTFISWTFPRLGPLKFSEFFGFLGGYRALGDKQVETQLLKCYLPFIFGSLFAFGMSLFNMYDGDNSLTSEKGLYSDPTLIPAFTLVRMIVYFVCMATLTSFFMRADREQIQRSLKWSYYVTIFPGLLQLFRIYSGIYFDLPFEREGFGPFSGVFDAGYLRLMGFEFEPLAYGTSLMVVCCVRMHATHKIPWLGMVVFGFTFSTGAIGALMIALVASQIRFVLRWFTLIYALAATCVFAFVVINYTELTEILFFLQSAMERVSAINGAITMMLDHPFGVGLGLYGYYFNLYNPFGFFEAPGLDHYPNNDLAMFLAYGGVIYAACYLWVFHYTLRRVRSFWLRIALLALMVQSFTSYLFFNPAIMLVLSLVLAGSQAEPAPVKVKRRRRPGFLKIMFPVPFRLPKWPRRPRSRIAS